VWIAVKAVEVMIPVEIVNVVLSDKGFIILLKSQEDNRALPIFIGQLEAQSIIIGLSDTKPARPLTHDLLKNVLEDLSCTLVRVEVCDLVSDTFYGKIVLEHNGVPVEIDSRPSDAIALAVRTQTPIFVAPKVMEEAKIILEEKDESQETVTVEEKAPEVPTLEALKKRLREAVQQERYEEAAHIRDEMKKLSSSN
jgi:bifunctional DNase/RNase